MVGTLVKFVPAQAVKVTRAGAELVLVHDVKIMRTHAITRTNTRGGPVDTYAWRIQELELLVLLTKDLQALIEVDNKLSASSVFTPQSYIITGSSQNAVANDNVVDSFLTTASLGASLIDYESLAPESGAYNARMKLRITGAVA